MKKITGKIKKLNENMKCALCIWNKQAETLPDYR
jgi:hypothetical protein